MPIILLDVNFEVIAMYPHHPIGEKVFDAYLQEQRTPEYLLDIFIKEDYFEYTAKNRGAVILDWGIHKECPRICCDIMIENIICGYLSMLCLDKRPDPIYMFIAENLSKALSLLIDKNTLTLSERNPINISFMNGLFVRGLGKCITMENWAKQLHVTTNGNFYVMTVQFPEHNAQKKHILTLISKSIKEQFPTILSLSAEEEIIILFNNIDQCSLDDSKSLIKRVADFLKCQGLICGLSMEFESLWDAKYAKEQSLRALLTGHRLFPERGFFVFSKVYLWCVAEKISEGNGGRVFFYPILTLLKQHDEENGTPYYFTLMEYLRNFKNHKKSSRNLHIHRNTLVYRLQKIEELLNINFEDPTLCFQLLLSDYIKDISD